MGALTIAGATALSGGLSALGGLTAAGINAGASAGATRRARKENYHYNELAAQNADQRTRALYNDLYSPGAQLQQLKDAGLSPSLMYQDGAGVSGQAGAQGAGTAGPVPNPFYLDPLTMAQTANLMADTKKKEAEAANTKEDTKRLEIENAVKEMESNKYKIEFTLNTSFLSDDDGNKFSLYEAARHYSNYDHYYAHINECAKKSNGELADYLKTEIGQKAVRTIYMARKQMASDIAILSNNEVSATFQQQIVNALQNTDFTKLNAEAAIGYLNANIQTAELTKSQKEAWNNIIAKLGDGTAKDIAVVLCMILNNALSNWNMPHVTNVTKTATNSDKTL